LPLSSVSFGWASRYDLRIATFLGELRLGKPV
jgi:hypothetical protein